MPKRGFVDLELPNGTSCRATLSEAKELVAQDRAVWSEHTMEGRPTYKRIAMVQPELVIRGLSCKVGAELAERLRIERAYRRKYEGSELPGAYAEVVLQHMRQQYSAPQGAA